MNSVVYDVPVKVYFGENQLAHLGPELARFGSRLLLTCGGKVLRGFLPLGQEDIEKTLTMCL